MLNSMPSIQRRTLKCDCCGLVIVDLAPLLWEEVPRAVLVEQDTELDALFPAKK